jgi:hypothetical protein
LLGSVVTITNISKSMGRDNIAEFCNMNKFRQAISQQLEQGNEGIHCTGYNCY